MKKTLLGTLLFAMAAVAVAETTRSVDWYRQRPFDRAAKLSECHDNPGELGKTPNCVNAEKAEALGPLKRTSSVPFPKGTPPMKGSDFDFSYGR